MEDGFSSDEEIANVLAAARAALVERGLRWLRSRPN